MKTLKNLDEKIEWYGDITDAEKNNLPTFRKLLKNGAGAAAAQNGEEAIDFYRIGLKLRCEGDVNLEDAEFKILKRACGEYSASKRQDGWIAHVQAQVLMKLQEAEKV